MRRQLQRLGFMKRAIIEQQQVEADGIGRGEMLEEELKALGIEERQFQKEPLASHWLHCPVQIHALKAIRSRDDGLDPTGGNPMPHDG
jgi:hypothetical protein